MLSAVLMRRRRPQLVLTPKEPVPPPQMEITPKAHVPYEEVPYTA